MGIQLRGRASRIRGDCRDRRSPESRSRSGLRRWNAASPERGEGPEEAGRGRRSRRGAGYVEEATSEGDDRQGEVESEGNYDGSSLQEGNFSQAAEEEEEQQLDLKAPPRVFGAAISQGSPRSSSSRHGRGVGELSGLRALPQASDSQQRRSSSSPARDADPGDVDGHGSEGGRAAGLGHRRAEAEVVGTASARCGRRIGAAVGADPAGDLHLGHELRGALRQGRAPRGREVEEAAMGEDPASLPSRRLEGNGQDGEPRRKSLREERGKENKGRREGEGVQSGEGGLLRRDEMPEGSPEEEGPPIFSTLGRSHGVDGMALTAADAVLREAALAAADGAADAPRLKERELSNRSNCLVNEALEGQAKTSEHVNARLIDLASKMLSSRPPSSRRISKEHVQEITEDAFPLPLPRDHRDSIGNDFHAWEEGLIRSINWLSTGSFEVSGEPPSRDQALLLGEIRHLGPLLDLWSSQDISSMNPSELFEQKLINSYGEEVHVARSVRWENVTESLPKVGVAGIVPAVEVCEGGFKDYVMHPSRWLKPEEERVYLSPPKVMVPREDWKEVCRGLIDRGICGLMPLSEAFCVEGQPVLGGIFGVPKHEKPSEGVDILRLIMDLRPINECFLNLGGDLSTLPVMSQMIQLELSPEEGILISSEDIRAMFYIIPGDLS